ncbi:MAG: adenylosuccinate synthetase [Clostridia bacterium]|nr:adenylosuccinate synthetase [Clostridia bacterium]
MNEKIPNVSDLINEAKTEAGKPFPYALNKKNFLAYNAGVAVVGSHFGDEGKGKIVDIAIRDYKEKGFSVINVRGQGGGNAGHTVIDTLTEEEYHFHYLPSGGLVSDIILLGGGMLLDPIRIHDEMSVLPSQQRQKILVDERATLSTMLERLMDGYYESKKDGKNKVGTTGSGVGPTVAYRALRVDIRFAQAKACKNADELKELFIAIPDVPQEIWDSIATEFDGIDNYMQSLYTAVQELNVVNSSEIIRYTKLHGWAVVLEVSQAFGLDSIFGNGGHMVTSTHTTVAGAMADAGLGLNDLTEGVILIAKGYASKVGGGHFVTKFDQNNLYEFEIDNFIHDVNGECGVTTGRRRLLGWFDCVCVREAILRNGANHKLAINCMDTIGMIPGSMAKICIAYRHKETGEIAPNWPFFQDEYEPIYKELKVDWQIKHFNNVNENTLPDGLWEYLGNIAFYTGADIGYIGTGGGNKDIIVISDYGKQRIFEVVSRLWAEHLESKAEEADEELAKAQKKADEARTAAEDARSSYEILYGKSEL